MGGKTPTMKSMTPRHFKLGELYQKLMFDKFEVNESMLVENIVAQMLKASGNELFFYFNDDKEDADSRMQPETTYLCE